MQKVLLFACFPQDGHCFEGVSVNIFIFVINLNEKKKQLMAANFWLISFMIFIATSVCEKVESKGRTPYNEVRWFVEVILLFLFIVFGGSYDIHCMSAYSYLIVFQ
jgi:hypothetical protein